MINYNTDNADQISSKDIIRKNVIQKSDSQANNNENKSMEKEGSGIGHIEQEAKNGYD